jgi:hypothetical protein
MYSFVRASLFTRAEEVPRVKTESFPDIFWTFFRIEFCKHSGRKQKAVSEASDQSHLYLDDTLSLNTPEMVKMARSLI